MYSNYTFQLLPEQEIQNKVSGNQHEDEDEDSNYGANH